VQEGPDLESAGFEHLKRQFARLNDLQKRHNLEHVEIEMLSKMADDDRNTSYAPLSFNALSLDATATDHLGTLQKFIVTTRGGIPPLAGYTLIRTAIEASSIALWLMGGGTKDKRILNTLRLVLDNRIDNENFAARMGTTDPAKNKHVRTRLEEIRDARPSLRKSAIKPMPSATSIIESSQGYVKKRSQYTGIQTWIACSGVAHANYGTNLILLERKQVGHGSPTGGTFHMTSSVSVLSSMFEVAVDFLEAARLMYEANSKAHGQSPK